MTRSIIVWKQFYFLQKNFIISNQSQYLAIFIFNFIIFGNKSTTAITVRYLTKRFIGEYSSAHGKNKKKLMLLNSSIQHSFFGIVSHIVDFLYKHSVNFEENHVPVEIEILDTCSVIYFYLILYLFTYKLIFLQNFLFRHVKIFAICNCIFFLLSLLYFLSQQNGCSYDDVIRWADSFLVIYSIVDRDSFHEAEKLLKKISKLKLPSYYTALMLGNKNDLEHSR